MKFKDGVFTRVTVVKNGVETTLEPSAEIKKAMQVADIVSREITGKQVTVTSVLDGKHKPGSRHYSGNAFDLRTFIYSKDQVKKLVQELKKQLGTDYDIVDETDHLHIEFDPK